MKRYIILLLITLTLLSCSQKSNFNGSTVNITKVLPLKYYQEDFDQMLKIILDKHPQPHAFISNDSLQNLAKLQYAKITDSTTVAEFFWICTKVVAAIKCGHTSIWPTVTIDIPKSCFFPMEVKYVGSKLYIIDTRENSDKLLVGEEILTINGVQVEKIQKDLFQYRYSDGHNITRKHEDTNQNFFWLCSMYFDFPASYIVTVKQNEKIKTINLKPSETVLNKRTFLDNYEKTLCLETDLEKSIATITIRHFNYYKKQLPVFESFIDSCFQHINENKIQHLIIDLRNNGGGDPYCSSYLLEHIADKSYTYFHKSAKWYGKLKKPIQPNPNRFKNKPYILVNGKCFSSTGHFCSIVKENNFGTFIGDETGSTYTCNDNHKQYLLKNTKFGLTTARRTYKTTATSFSNKHGIIPDHFVIPTIDNILNNTDTVLNYTLKLIENK